MYELKTNTATRIAVGPLVDPTDGKTAETALTVTGMTVDILQMDNDGTAVNRTSFSPTASGGNNDMVHITNDAVGMYDLELTAAQLNYLGNMRLVFYDVDGFLVHWIDLQVVSAAYFDWKYGTTLPNVNVTQISGDGTAADNAELFFDGTGYAGGTTKLDVNVVTIANNAITAASINADAITNAKIADNAIAAENIAADAITAAKIANGAIDAATFAADADAEIAAMVWNAATASYGGAGTYGQAVEDTLADTNELQGDWVNGGRLDLLLDGASAPSAATVADAVWDEALAGHAGAGSAGAALTAAGSAGDPWATLIPGAYGAGTAGLLLGTTIPNAIDAIDNYVDTEVGALTTELAKVPKSDSNVSWNATALAAIQGECTDALNAYDPPTNAEIPTAAAIADAVWDEASTGHTDAGKAGAQVWTDIDAILEDTGTTLDTLVKDIPTVAEFEARTIAAADYTVVSDLGTVQTGDSFAIVNGDHGLVSIQDDIDAILADTNELQTDDYPTSIAAVKTVVDLIEDIIRNRMDITDADGTVSLKDDSGNAYLAGTVTDNSTTTTRTRLA